MVVAQRSTLVGVATGTPDGGVAIIRISGPRARVLGDALLVGGLPPARTLALRELRLGEGVGESILAVLMPGPRSFTGEDVVELHVHAGERNVSSVLERVLEVGASLDGEGPKTVFMGPASPLPDPPPTRGTVPAGPGDFTRRAFENGRLTLDQAEGIAALIGARTQAALDHARRLVAGELGREVEQVRGELERLRIEIEANLDFPEDVAAADEGRWLAEVVRLRGAVDGWLVRFERGRRARSRARVAIAGPPNAGKSALLNALLGRRRALVSEQAGTTRDFVEAELRIGARELVLVDTAGLRESEDPLERAGVELGREQIEGAELIVWVEGADQPEQPQWTREREQIEASGAALLCVENKRDLGSRRPAWLGVSASSGAGLDALGDAIVRALGEVDEGWIGLARHRDRAQETVAALVEAEEQLRAGLGLELVAFSLALGQRRLGEITGHTGLGPVGAEVLDAIFSRFCIGK